MKRLFKICISVCTALLLAVQMPVFTSCEDDLAAESYYTFTGEMMSDYLKNRENFSLFRRIVERSPGKMDFLAARGKNTFFPPVNSGVEAYLQEMGYASVEDIPVTFCDTLVRACLVDNNALYSSDMVSTMQLTNELDLPLIIVTNDTVVDANGMTLSVINSSSNIINELKNDSVDNGVIHPVDRMLVPNTSVGASILEENHADFGIFFEALNRTGLLGVLKDYRDEDYEVWKNDYPEFMTGIRSGGRFSSSDAGYPYWAKRPDHLDAGYTVFVERDNLYQTVYDPQNMGKPIYTGDLESDVRSLFNYAKSIYDEVYPDDAGLYDEDYTHPKNPLHRYMAYHILDRNASYGDLVVSTPDWSVPEGGDYVEYYETMAGNLMRMQKVSLLADQIRINRCDDPNRSNNRMDGIEVLSSGGASTVNGNFQFVNGLLSYNTNVVNMLRTERIRIDTGVLFPELVNNSVRLDPDVRMLWWHFPEGYFDDVYYDDQCDCKYNRWPQFGGPGAGMGNYFDLAAFRTDNMNFAGEYDVTLRLPAVPAGQYEIRIGYVCNGFMGISQIYFGFDREHMQPTNIPINMGLIGYDPKVGGVLPLYDDINNDPAYNTTGMKTMTENDKSMRNLGYMMGPDCVHRVDNDRVTKLAKLSENWWYLRYIVTTQNLEEKPFYLRFRKVDDRTSPMLNVDFVEIVPSYVYNGPRPEDRH